MEASPTPSAQPNSGRQTRSKGPARRRIMRKARRQTLELLTSDDEVNELVESRPSTYIEPSARQHLHETRPHLRSSFETLYNPQFDAPDGPGLGADRADKSDEDAESSSSGSSTVRISQQRRHRQQAVSLDARVNGGGDRGGDGGGRLTMQQFDRRWEESTTGPVDGEVDETVQVAVSSAGPLAARLSVQKQPQQWQRQKLDARCPSDLTPADASRYWANSQNQQHQQIQQQQQQWQLQQQQQHRSAIEEMDSLADELLRTREALPPSKLSADTTDGRNATDDRNQLRVDAAANSLGFDWASKNKILSPKKTVAFRLPEEAALSQLRARISGGGGASERRPHLQFVRGQPVRADIRVAAAAAAAAAPPEEPARPSVAQQLRAILPDAQLAEAPSQAAEVPTNHSRMLHAAPMSAQVAADRHVPRRSGSLTRSDSYDRSANRSQSGSLILHSGGSLRGGLLATPAAGEPPMRRTWSVLQPQAAGSRQQLQRQQLQRQQQQQQLQHQQQQHQQQQHQQQQHQQQQHQQQQQDQDEPPPLPPRRINESLLIRVPSAQLSTSRQPNRGVGFGFILFGRDDLPSVDHVYKRIRKPAARHRITVAPRQWITHQRPAAAAPTISWNLRDGRPQQRHLPAGRGWQAQQYSAKFA